MISKVLNYEPDSSVTEKWDSGEYGRSLEHAVVVSEALSDSVDESLDLQLVSIRLQRSLVKNLKLIAKYRGKAYQPLVRDLLNRFAISELKDIFHELQDAAQRKASEEPEPIVDGFIAREQEERKRA